MAGKVVERNVAGSYAQSVDPAFVDPEFERKYPTLLGYMTQNTWQDGSLRETATILLFSDGNSLKACLNDRANNRSAFVVQIRFEEILEALEEGLANQTLDWKTKYKPRGAVDKIPW